MKTNNKKKNQYKSFVFNKKNIGKIIILIFLIILSIAIYLKIRSNVIEENLNDNCVVSSIGIVQFSSSHLYKARI